MKREIANELKSYRGTEWADEFLDFVNNPSTELLSESPGKCRVAELIANLNIRIDSARKTGIQTVGMSELIMNLKKLREGAIVRDYVFKSDQKTGILYIDRQSERVVGAVLVSDNELNI